MPDYELIAELHDVGKLLDNEALSKLTGLQFAHHYFSNRRYEPLDLGVAGLPTPTGPMWAAIRYHGGRGIGPSTELNNPPARVAAEVGDALPDVYLTILADHLASSTSRPVPEEIEARPPQTEDWPPDISKRHCLWRHDTRQRGDSGPLIATVQELRIMLEFISSDPRIDRFYEQYGHLLDEIPEEKGFPGGVTTLRTHCNLVGRFYRVLRSVVQRTSRGLSYAGNEQRVYGRRELPALGGHPGRPKIPGMETEWRFRLARCRVHIPTAPARFRDLGVFQRLEDALDQLRDDPDRQDHLLLSTFQDLWLFLPLEDMRPLSEVLSPLLEAGFHVESTVREAPLTNLTQWGSLDDGASEISCYLQPELPAQIHPPLCEVCQLAPGSPRQEHPDDVTEHLCDTCATTRDRYSERFVRLGSWTEGYAAWLRVSLDFEALEDHLKELFRRYVSEVGKNVVDQQTQEQLVKNLRTTALAVDYVKDFLEMQQDLERQLRTVFPEEDVETLTSQRKEVFVVRLDKRQDVLRILQLCHTSALRHFSRSAPNPPFRIAISVGPVRFPFGEHWRLLQPATDEVTAYLIGSGRLACRLERVPHLLSLAQQPGRPRRGLHHLADLAGQSPALARVALDDREERDLTSIAPRLAELGLDFESMAAFARLAKEGVD